MLVVVVRVVVTWEVDVRRVLSVSTIVELVVARGVVPGERKMLVAPTVVKLDVVTVLQEVVVIVVIEVVAADDTVDTAVVTVGPSGCRRRAILLDPNSVNHTFRVVPLYVLFRTSPCGFAFEV